MDQINHFGIKNICNRASFRLPQVFLSAAACTLGFCCCLHSRCWPQGLPPLAGRCSLAASR
ncbi:hypothetical protein Syun_020856 [Stephania yunnanensis]|uniref:Uncharacterized protein n=1 Tax=Stephania yunnanensis TaxID=152371 RepID=A0AAP0IEJ7_9MAGN